MEKRAGKNRTSSFSVCKFLPKAMYISKEPEGGMLESPTTSETDTIGFTIVKQ